MRKSAAEQDRTRRLKGRSEYRVDATQAAVVEMRRRLADAEQALAECNHEAAEVAGELAAAREDLHRTCMARDEAEKISAGLKQHITLLLADVKEWPAAIAAAQQARLADKARIDRRIAGLAREVKQMLAALDSSRLDLAVRLGEAESARAHHAAQLEVLLNRQADEIEMLVQVVKNKQHERFDAERQGRAAAGAVGRAAGPLLVRRQARLQ